MPSLSKIWHCSSNAEKIYYLDDDSGFPISEEKLGFWCGPTVNCGDAMTYWILTEDTTQLIARSVVRSAVDAESQNQRINPQVSDDTENGEGKDMILSSLNEILSVLKGKKVSPKFNPTDLIGYSYVKDHDDMLQRATITDVNTDDGI